MRMKKFLQLSAATAALTLTLTMGVTALAESVKDMTWEVKKEAGTTVDTRQSVEIKMAEGSSSLFTYTVKTNKVWDPDNFTVKEETKGEWNQESATVVVTNKSKVGVLATFSLDPADTDGFTKEFKTTAQEDTPLQPDGTMEGQVNITSTDTDKMAQKVSIASSTYPVRLGTVTVTLKSYTQYSPSNE